MVSGWDKIIKMAEKVINEEIEKVDHPFPFMWKEKYGTMRLEYIPGTERAYKMERIAYKKSARTCDVCGARGEVNYDLPWYAARCKEHWDD